MIYCWLLEGEQIVCLKLLLLPGHIDFWPSQLSLSLPKGSGTLEVPEPAMEVPMTLREHPTSHPGRVLQMSTVT